MDLAIEEYRKKIENKTSIGTYEGRDASCFPHINLENASHLVESIKIVDSNVIASIRTLDTPRGKLLHALMESKRVNFYIIGIGKLENNVVTDYTITSVGVSHKSNETDKQNDS